MAVALTTAVALATGLPGTAWAHSQLITTAPADAATVTEPVGEVVLTFNEHPHQRFSMIVVHGPGNVSYSNGGVRVIDATVHQSVYPLKSGKYTVGWRVVSADDHPVQGEFSFTVALPADLEPVAGPPTAGPSAGSAAAGPRTSRTWPAAAWVIGLVAVAAMLAVVVVRRRRTSPSSG